MQTVIHMCPDSLVDAKSPEAGEVLGKENMENIMTAM